MNQSMNTNNGGNGVGGGGGGAPAKADDKQTELKDTIILATHIHCEGCANDIIKCLRGFEGVEDVKVNSKQHRVLVKGKKADPLKVLERVRAKCRNKHVELISPIPKPKPKPDPAAKAKPKAPEDDDESLVMIIVIKIYIHCENCAQETKSCILRMKGVQSVTVDAPKKQMTVIGLIEPQSLVKYLYDRAGKHATIVKQEYQDKEKASKRLAKLKKNGNNKAKQDGGETTQTDETNKDKKLNDVYYHYPPQYNPDPLYPCLVFSDENPHACGIM